MDNYNQIQYVIGKDDLKEVLREIIDERISFFMEKMNDANRDEELVTSKKVMELLEISKPTLSRWKKRGYLVPVRIGGNDRYRMSDIKKIMKGE